MATTTPNMTLKVFDLLSDLYDHSAVANNWVAVDQHEHTAGKGVQIPSGGIADGAVTTSKIASQAVTAAQIANGTITTAQISATAGITLGQLATGAGALHVATIATNGQTNAQAGYLYLVNGTPTLVNVRLPAPTLHACVGVFNIGNCGVGVSAASALIEVGGTNGGYQAIIGLGTYGAGAVFYSDGVHWFLVSGDADFGWNDVTYVDSSVSTPPGGVHAAVRQIGKTVVMQGGLITTGISANTVWASLPTPWSGTGVTPPATTQHPFCVFVNAAGGAGPYSHNATIDTSGNISLDIDAPIGTYMAFSGAGYVVA